MQGPEDQPEIDKQEPGLIIPEGARKSDILPDFKIKCFQLMSTRNVKVAGPPKAYCIQGNYRLVKSKIGWVLRWVSHPHYKGLFNKAQLRDILDWCCVNKHNLELIAQIEVPKKAYRDVRFVLMPWSIDQMFKTFEDEQEASMLENITRICKRYMDGLWDV